MKIHNYGNDYVARYNMDHPKESENVNDQTDTKTTADAEPKRKRGANKTRDYQVKKAPQSVFKTSEKEEEPAKTDKEQGDKA